MADAYEAMIADRPYRPGMPPGAARAELRRCAGTQFDPDVVDAFLRALDRQSEEARHPDAQTVAIPVGSGLPSLVEPGRIHEEPAPAGLRAASGTTVLPAPAAAR